MNKILNKCTWPISKLTLSQRTRLRKKKNPLNRLYTCKHPKMNKNNHNNLSNNRNQKPLFKKRKMKKSQKFLPTGKPPHKKQIIAHLSPQQPFMASPHPSLTQQKNSISSMSQIIINLQLAQLFTRLVKVIKLNP